MLSAAAADLLSIGQQVALISCTAEEVKDQSGVVVSAAAPGLDILYCIYSARDFDYLTHFWPLRDRVGQQKL